MKGPGIWAAALVALLCFSGCTGQKRVESQVLPSRSPAQVQEVKAQDPPPAVSLSHRVARGDTLWSLSDKHYQDPFQWPLIFKANRDQIADPDLIYPRQELRIIQGAALEEVQRARRVAGNTPKYVPHTRPRAALPVDYF